MMKNSLKKKAFFLVFIVVILNSITLYFWLQLKIIPMIGKNEKLESMIIQEELKTHYDTLEELLSDIEGISLKYPVKLFLEDVLGNELTTSLKKESDIFLFSDIMVVGDKMYSLSIYSTKNISTIGMITQLIVFQIIIVSFCMMLIFLLTRSKIIKPVDRIIQDIRNYKLGKRPIKRNRVNNEFDLIQNEFVTLVDSLEEEHQEQTRIIASISHDLKTPLTSIIGYANFIDESHLTKEEMKKYNLKIKEKSLIMKSILTGFDDYLMNQTNQKLKLDTISIHDLVKDLINDYKVDLEGNQIDFVVQTKLENEMIQVDVLKLKRIFANIITNSIRYLDSNGKIMITITKKEHDYCFKVWDNGPGVDENIIDKVFDPLFTTDTSRKISGLGLSIVKEFVLMHHGNVWAYNEFGFVVEFTIPDKVRVE